jgi:glycerol uptake facilitator-like aquaporin
MASFLLVFWSAVAALMQEMHGTLTFPMVCLVVALTAAFVLCWLGPAHFNPAVTVTFTVFGYLSWTKVRRIYVYTTSPGHPYASTTVLGYVLCIIVSSSCPQLPFYVAAQLAGSLLACLSANGVMEPRAEHFYGTVPMAGGDTRLPFLLELVASALLMVVVATAARGSVRLSLSSFLSVNLLRPSRRVLIMFWLMANAESDSRRAGHRRRRRHPGSRHRVIKRKKKTINFQFICSQIKCKCHTYTAAVLTSYCTYELCIRSIQAGVRRLDEPDQDPGPGHRARQVHLRLDLSCRARRRDAHRRPLQPPRQALRRHHRLPLRRQAQSGGARPEPRRAPLEHLRLRATSCRLAAGRRHRGRGPPLACCNSYESNHSFATRLHPTFQIKARYLY